MIEKRTGFKEIVPAVTNANLVALYKLGLLEENSDKMCFPKDLTAAENNRTSIIRMLHSQDIIEAKDRDHTSEIDKKVKYQIAPELYKEAQALIPYVETYTYCADMVDHMLGYRQQVNTTIPDILTKGDQTIIDETLSAPALSILKELRLGGDETLAEQLLAKKLLNLETLAKESSDESFFLLCMNSLKNLNILEGASDCTGLSENSHRALRNAGVAMLEVCYYPAMQHLDKLYDKKEIYHPDNKTVHRRETLNAKASDHMIGVKVTNTLAEILGKIGKTKTPPSVAAILEKNGVFLDFGAGGGDNVRTIVQSPLVKKAYGMDLTPEAVDKAKSETKRLGIDRSTISFEEGDIGSEEWFKDFKVRMEAQETPDIVATINFILHDVPRDLAKKFLGLFKKYFPNSILLATESLRLDAESNQTNPDRLSPIFENWHLLSLQELFKKDEILSLFKECGYEVIFNQVHSYSPDHTKKRENYQETITTFGIKPVA